MSEQGGQVTWQPGDYFTLALDGEVGAAQLPAGGWQVWAGSRPRCAGGCAAEPAQVAGQRQLAAARLWLAQHQ